METQEIFSLDDMIELFDIAEVNKAPSAFNRDKLDWLNQHYIQQGDPKHIAHLLSPHMGHIGIDPTHGPELVDVVRAQGARAKTLIDLAEISAFCYRDFDAYDDVAAKKHLRPVAQEPLARMRAELELLSFEDWQPEMLHHLVERVAAELELTWARLHTVASRGGWASGIARYRYHIKISG